MVGEHGKPGEFFGGKGFKVWRVSWRSWHWVASRQLDGRRDNISGGAFTNRGACRAAGRQLKKWSRE